MRRRGGTTSNRVSATGRWPRSPRRRCRIGLGSLVARGLAPSTATRALATLRSILAFAVADARVQHNVAAAAQKPTRGRARREGQALTSEELRALMAACRGRYRDIVPVLALAGLRWGELAGLRVSDRVSVPGPGLRSRRTVLASGGGGALYVDTLKNNRGRTVPLVVDLVPIVDRWSSGEAPDAWLFEAPRGGPLRESNWKRSVGWSAATAAVGLPGFRVHDLRHTAASVWLGARADPKVVQRVLGMPPQRWRWTSTVTWWMPTCGRRHGLSGASWGHLSRPNSRTRTRTMRERTKVPGVAGFLVEPPIGIEPMTYALRVRRSNRLS